MRSFQRSQVQTLLDRLNEPPRHILAVFGPRLVAVEVERETRLRPTRSLEVFDQRFAPHRSIVVGDRSVPLNEFLTQPAATWFEGQ